VTRIELNLEHPVGEGLDDLALHLDLFFLRCQETKDTPGGGGKPAAESYDPSVGALTANLLSRKRRTSANGRSHRETWRFVCYLDRLPPHVLEDDAFTTRHSKMPEVECEIEADDFAAAVAEAIRSLEDEFTHVQSIERLSL
jgi:hypothetical protein